LIKLIVLIGAILGGICYRLGGTNKGTLWRDLGVSLITIILLYIILGGIK
jgi:hypothetical protein